MRQLVLLLVFLLVFTGVAAYKLHQRRLLTRESLDLFLKPQPETEGDESPSVEPVGLAASIQKKEQKLEEESERLQQLSARLEKQREELKAERAVIEETLQKIKPELESGTGLSAARKEMAELVKMYENMPPEQAAAILENLPDPTVAEILLQMRRRQAAQIMGSLQPNKAAGISTLLASEEAEAAR